MRTIKIGLAAIFFLAISCTKQNIHTGPAITAQSQDNNVQRLHIGDTLAGGIIFYLDSTRKHGLVSAFQNQGIARWYNGVFMVTGATGTAIGTGADNTRKIIFSQKSGMYAAILCKKYRGGGYTDWFLPSIDELHKLYEQKDIVGGFSDFLYWSSTEIDSTIAEGVLFRNGIDYNKSKGGQFYVRAVRAF